MLLHSPVFCSFLISFSLSNGSALPLYGYFKYGSASRQVSLPSWYSVYVHVGFCTWVPSLPSNRYTVPKSLYLLTLFNTIASLIPSVFKASDSSFYLFSSLKVLASPDTKVHCFWKISKCSIINCISMLCCKVGGFTSWLWIEIPGPLDEKKRR